MSEVPGWAEQFFAPPHKMLVRFGGVAGGRPNETTGFDQWINLRYAMLDQRALRETVERCGAKLLPGTVPPRLRGVDRSEDDVAEAASPDSVVLIDATGAPRTGMETWQVAVGVVIPVSQLPGAPEPEFMDWRMPTSSPPSFLYIQPVKSGVLFEETVLATRTSPEELFEVLQSRLLDRISARYPHLRDELLAWDRDSRRGLPLAFHRELVAIPMGTRKSAPWSTKANRFPRWFNRPRWQNRWFPELDPSRLRNWGQRRAGIRLPFGQVVKGGSTPLTPTPPLTLCFGAAGGLINPATGYSVSAAMNLADSFLDCIAEHVGANANTPLQRSVPESPTSATTGTSPDRLHRHSSLTPFTASVFTARWVANAELARWLRRVGAELICRADHATLESFFRAFFALPAHQQSSYLTGHNGIAVARAMWAMRRVTGLRHPFLRPLWTQPLNVLWRMHASPRRRSSNGPAVRARRKSRGSAAVRGLPR